MAYRRNNENRDEEIAPPRPVQRRSTLPTNIAISPQSAMPRPSRSHIPPPFAAASAQPGLQRQNKVANVDEVSSQLQNSPIIIKNYIGADPGDSVDHRSQTRNRQRGPRYYDGDHDNEDEDDFEAPTYITRLLPTPPPSFSSSEDDDSNDFYGFTSSYKSVSSGSLEDRASLSDSSTHFLPTIGPSPLRSGKIMHIYKAQYMGDACLEGSHALSLTCLHEPRHPQQALFRWIHIEQQVMDFDAFWDEIAGIINLTSAEKRGIKMILQDVKNRGVKRVVTAQGHHKIMQMKGFSSRKLQLDGTDIPTSRDRAVHWANLPFFELKKYSSENHSPELFPAQTLMQADLTQHPMERDMQQAVRQMNIVPGHHCFHISQLWVMIIDNCLLVTCGTMSHNKLCDKVIDITSSPPRGDSDECEPKILVEYGENTLWAIPLEECLDWFAFITHFWEFWPDTVEFYWHRKLLSSNDWQDIVESARQGTNKVLLEAIERPPPSPPARGGPIVEIEAPAEQAEAGSVSKKDTERVAPTPPLAAPNTSAADELSQKSRSFNVFACIRPTPGVPRTKAAQVQLGDMKFFIQRKTREKDRLAYDKCPEATADKVRAELEHLASEQSLLALDESSSVRQALRDRIDVFNATVVIFTFFLPLKFDGPTVEKVWGSLGLLLDRPWPKDKNEEHSLHWTRRQQMANRTLGSARKALRNITRQILLFQQVMSHAPVPKMTGINIPDQLLQAYIYFVLAIVQASAGMRAMLKSYSPASLSTYSSILPTEVLSLISLSLLGDWTGPCPDINNVYSEWINKLDNAIEKKPALSHQEKIQWLTVEINVIMETLEQQSKIFDDILRRAGRRTTSISRSRQLFDPYVAYVQGGSRRTIANDQARVSTRARERSSREPGNSRIVHYTPTERNQSYTYQRPYNDEGSVYSDRYEREDLEDGFQLSALDPGGYRLLLAGGCQSIINQRLDEFRQFKRKAEALQQANMYKAETRKDYRDQALYAFTIVTVIFLPLSAISSIFGMNTSDIRNLEQGQWLYWATAVPVTVGVIIIGLWWMGELGNTTLWLLNQREPVVAITDVRSMRTLQRGVDDVSNDEDRRQDITPRLLGHDNPMQPIARTASGRQINISRQTAGR